MKPPDPAKSQSTPRSEAHQSDSRGSANRMKSAQGSIREDFVTRPIWLVRGKDRSGRNDFNVGHDGSYRDGQRISEHV